MTNNIEKVNKYLKNKAYKDILNNKLNKDDIYYPKYVFNINYMHNLLQKKFQNNTDLMDKCEDNIYTLNGVQLTQIQRIKLELFNILKKLTLEKDKLSNKEIMQIMDLKNSIDKLDANNKVEIHSIKKRISDTQAKLNIKMKFLRASWDLSNDLYDSALDNLIELERQKESEGKNYGRN